MTAQVQQGGSDAGALVPCDRKRILIVDDEQSIRDILFRVMSMHLSDCRVDLAVNGIEAFDVFREAHPGILVMDVKMPKRSGDEAFLDIQKYCRKNNWEMPSVVFVSGYSSEDINRLIEGDPRHCILRKPVHQADLLAKLRERLGNNNNG